MTTSHTPGPWSACITPSGLEVYQDDGHGNGDHIIVDGEQAEAHANARLIAAAPELLAALQYVTEFLVANYDDHDMPDILPACRAAIAKAVQS